MFDTINLGLQAYIEMGQSPDSNYVSDNLEVGMPFLQGNAEFSVTHPKPKYTCTKPLKVCKKGDLLISVRAPVGEVNIADQDYCIGRGLAAIRFKNIPPTIGKALIENTRLQLYKVAQGSTFEAINKQNLFELRIANIPSNELLILEDIFTNLETQIHETEAIIAKLQQVKQGLLHDLLTRGVDENGGLRPSYEDAPELYKPSELGWIPKQWDVKTIEELGGFVTSGSRDWAQYYSERGDLFIRIGNLTREHINFRFDKIQYVTPPKLGDGQRTKLVSGDILVSITADLGIVGVISEEIGTAYINQHIAMIRFSNEGVNARFIGHFLGSSNFQRLLSAKNDAGAKAGLNLPTVRSFPVLTVGKTEQDEIANRLDSMDKSIEIERVCLNKLKLKKSGLMEDLLTGKVRVTELIKQQQAS